MTINGLRNGILGGLATALVAPAALAEPVAGKPVPGQTGFQAPVTGIMEDVIWLDTFLLVIITVISLFVVALLVYVGVRFHKSKNATPATFTHNAKLEVVWTALPVVILVIIVVPSLRLLGDQLIIPEADVTVKATGNQWNWTYSYPGTEIEYTSYMVGYGHANAADATPELEEAGFTRGDYLFAVDSPLVVPVDKTVHVLVTGADVIHAFAVPSFGIKIDAMPARTNETWFKADTIGTYYGQCSELCGKDHAYMPIMVEVVSDEDYAAFLEDPEGFIEILTERRRAANVALAAAN